MPCELGRAALGENGEKGKSRVPIPAHPPCSWLVQPVPTRVPRVRRELDRGSNPLLFAVWWFARVQQQKTKKEKRRRGSEGGRGRQKEGGREDKVTLFYNYY